MSDLQSAERRRIPRPVPVHPLLFAAYPTLFLYSQNLGEVAADDVLPVLLVLVLGALVALIAMSLVFRDPRRAAIVVSVVAIAFLAYGFVDRGLPSFVPVSVQQVGWLTLIVVVDHRRRQDPRSPGGGHDRPQRHLAHPRRAHALRDRAAPGRDDEGTPRSPSRPWRAEPWR